MSIAWNNHDRHLSCFARALCAHGGFTFNSHAMIIRYEASSVNGCVEPMRVAIGSTVLDKVLMQGRQYLKGSCFMAHAPRCKVSCLASEMRTVQPNAMCLWIVADEYDHADGCEYDEDHDGDDDDDGDDEDSEHP